MLEPFQLLFVQRALLEVLLLSIGAGLVGTWIVMRGLAFYSHAVGAAAGAREGARERAARRGVARARVRPRPRACGGQALVRPGADPPPPDRALRDRVALGRRGAPRARARGRARRDGAIVDQAPRTV